MPAIVVLAVWWYCGVWWGIATLLFLGFCWFCNERAETRRMDD